MTALEKGYRPEIDGLRAIAVSSVILFHLHAPGVSGGYVGVDVFFVISGFLIAGIVWRQCEGDNFDLKEFYRRRVLRLFPALLSVCVATLVVGLVVLLPTDLARLGRSLVATMAYGSNVWLWRNTGYFDPQADSLPLLHTWSLAVEEQFYLGFPIALLLAHRLMRRRTVSLMLFTAGLCLVASQYFLISRQSAVFYLTPFRAWEFLVGSTLAVSGWVPRGASLRGAMRWLGAAAVIAPAFVYDSRTDFPGITALAPALGTGLLLVSIGPNESDFVASLLRSRPLVTVGKLSYSLYLWHWPVLVLWEHATGAAHTPGSLTTVIALTVLLSLASYRLIESPLRHPESPKARVVLWGSLTTSVALAAAGLAVNATNGFPQRVDPQVASLDRAREAPVPLMPCFGPSVSPDCVLGAAETTPSWILWGDSHALALAPALDVALKSRSEAALLIASSACPPLFDVDARDLRTGDWRCSETAARFSAAFEAHPRLKGVILVAIWPDYFTDAGSQIRLRDRGGERGNSSIMRDALTITLERLAGRTNVIVAARVPRQPWSVPEELARALHAGRTPAPGVSEAKERAVQASFFETMDRVSSQPRIQIVDLVSHFCRGGTCAYSREGRPLYRDAHHLNVEGAIEAMELVRLAMDRVSKVTVDANSAGH